MDARSPVAIQPLIKQLGILRIWIKKNLHHEAEKIIINKENNIFVSSEEQSLVEERGIEEEHVDNWWDKESKAESEEDFTIVEKKEELSQEQKEINRNIEIIQAHEKTR